MPCVITNNVIGVVLAGGQSKRMGQDKALLDVKGKPLWLHALQILQSVYPKFSNIVVSVKPLKSVIQSQWVDHDIQENLHYIPDVYPNLGPLGGIYSVLCAFWEHLEKEQALFIIPIDMPCLTTEGMNHLLTKSASLQHYDAVHYQDTIFPLFLRFTQNVQNYFLKLVQNLFLFGHTSAIQNMLAQLNTGSITYPFQQKNFFTNVNTSDEWQRFLIEGKNHEYTIF